MLLLCDRLPDMGHLKSEISDLRSQAESVSRQLRGWADSLQNSDITGQRYLNDRTRQASDHARRASQFWEKLEREHVRRMGWVKEGVEEGQRDAEGDES